MPNTEHLDPKSLSEENSVAFYGAMFAMAAADAPMQREELELIYETLDTEGLSDEARRRLYAYAIEPPALQDCLRVLGDASEASLQGATARLARLPITFTPTDDMVDLDDPHVAAISIATLSLDSESGPQE